MNARRRLLPLAALGLVVPALSSCQLLGGGSSFDDAMEVVPGDSTVVTFLDRAANAERLDVDDLATGATEEEVGDYLDALADDPVGGTPLVQYLAVMQDAALSELDVRWWIAARSEDDPYVNVYKVDDVDLDQLADDLTGAGFDSEERDGRTFLTASSPTEVVDGATGLIAGAYPLEFAFGTMIDPDEDLVVTGTDLDRLADVLDDDEDSLVDTGAFEYLAGSADDAELAYLAQDPDCGGGRSTPEVVERSGVDDLGTPEELGYFAGDDATTGVLRFADDEEAEADAEARTSYLEDGTSLISGVPVSDLGSAEVEQDGDEVRLDLDLAKPTLGRQTALQADAFFACPPG